jgi:hypothetical protein
MKQKMLTAGVVTLLAIAAPAYAGFVSVDPVTAYRNPIEMFNRYRYANGNPYKYTDPNGQAVSLAGSLTNQITFVQQIHQFTGSTVAIDKQGNLSITATDPGIGYAGAATALSNAINSPDQINLNLVNDNRSVFIDSYAHSTVDVADLAGFAAADNALGAAALTHVLTEYTTAMQAGGMTSQNFGSSHNAGLAAENSVMKAVNRTDLGYPAPGNSYGVKYQDMFGITKTYNFVLDKNGTPAQ